MKKIVLIITVLCFAYLKLIGQTDSFTTEDVLNIASFRVSDITDDGRYIAGTIRQRTDRMNIDHKRYGDPNYVSPSKGELIVLDTYNGEQYKILEHKAVTGRVKWSSDGKILAFLVYNGDEFRLNLYDINRKKLKEIKLKTDLKIASNSILEWLPDGNSIILSLRTDGWSEKADSMFTEATAGPVTVYDSKRPFLKWEELQNFSSLSQLGIVDIRSSGVKTILPEGAYSNINLTAGASYMTYVVNYPEKTVYNRKGGTDYELLMIDIKDLEEKKVLIERSDKRISIDWNEDKNRYAYTDSGKIFVRSVYEEEPVRVTADTTEIVKKDTSEVKFSVERWSPDGNYLLAGSKKGYWLINLETKEMELVYEYPEEKDKTPRQSIVSWSPDGKYLYMSYSARDKWERGLVIYDLDSRRFNDLVKDANLYSGWRMSKDGAWVFYNFSDGDRPSNLFVASSDFSETRQLTDLNPWIENRKITRSELIKYLDSDGKELYGVLYYPVDYKAGEKYPLVCEIYENFFNNGYSYSMNLIANAGYFGFKPSVNLIEGYPGEAWIKGVTAGINKLIDMELVDPDKLGVHGTSYGGYAASLLISQTDRFAAAINISGKTNIISFLGDSPRIGTRNYAAAEVGQDRIGESLWDAPMKYFATSAVMFADRINTPHLLLTGEGDWNVPALNTRELYYAMRRLGKEVVWVNYQNGGHGAGMASDRADFFDHWDRILDWYATHFEEKEE